MKAYLVSMDGKPPVSRMRYAWWRFVGRHLPMLLSCLMAGNVDRRRPRRGAFIAILHRKSFDEMDFHPCEEIGISIPELLVATN